MDAPTPAAHTAHRVHATHEVHTTHEVHATHEVHEARGAHETLASFEYRPELTAGELIAEVLRLLGVERGAERLVCRYLADLADRVRHRQDLAFQLHADELEAARCSFGLGPREARERVRIGRALRQLPAIERALVDGELSYSRVREITRVATPDSEAEWIELARRLDMRTLERQVAQTQAGAEWPGTESPGGKTRRVTFELSEQACLLLQRALEGARRASGDDCSDGQALEVVARAALAVQAAETGQHDTSNGASAVGTRAEKSVRPWSWDDLGWGTTQSGSSHERKDPSAANGFTRHATNDSTRYGTDRPAHDAANGPTHDAANGPTHDAANGPTHDAANGPTHDAANGPTHDAAGIFTHHAAGGSARHAAGGSARDAAHGFTRHTAHGSTRHAAGGSNHDAVGESTYDPAELASVQLVGSAGAEREWRGDADDRWWANSEPDSSDASERERTAALELDEWGAINSRLLNAMGGGGRWDADSLIEATGLSAREVNTALTYLELGGRIRRRQDAFEPT